MDNIDYKIIHLLSSNGRMNINDIAKCVFLSSPAVSSRIKKLEKNGIIIDYRIRVDYNLLEIDVFCLINLFISRNYQDEVITILKDMYNVVEIYETSGNSNISLKAFFNKIEEIDIFVKSIEKYGDININFIENVIK
ncbi:MAG: Lrp/AsnC family transcriptional regulator [Oscillospiraceae bacterium]